MVRPRSVRSLSAFTLLELIIVIGIVTALMGIGVGAWLRYRTASPLIATEHLLADSIRQARAVARSSGAPVSLVLDGSANSVRGLTRRLVWAEAFETVSDPWIAESGRTGRGLRVGATVGTSAFVGPTAALADRDTGRILRLDPGRGGGFTVSVNIRPPTPSTSRRELPVLALVPESASGDSFNDAVLGLALTPVSNRVHEGTSQDGPAAPDLFAHSWQIVAWVGAAGTGRTLLASQAWVPPTASASASGYVGAAPILEPMTGHRWYALDLTLDQTGHLALRRDGYEVATATIPPPSPLHDGPLAALVGSITFPGESAPVTADDADIDDCQIWRLGGDPAIPLPRGAALAGTTVLTIGPYGTVAMSGAAQQGTITANGPDGSSVTLVVDANGALQRATTEMSR